MKKVAICLLIVIAIISTISYLYLNFIFVNRNAQRENVKFEIYKDKEILGSELTTLINKAVDYNKQNEVSKDNKGQYIDNENNSLNIDIKFLDNDSTYNMQKIYSGGMDTFYSYYKDIKFKCNEVQYHKTTNKVKYMLFEQITQ